MAYLNCTPRSRVAVVSRAVQKGYPNKAIHVFSMPSMSVKARYTRVSLLGLYELLYSLCDANSAVRGCNVPGPLYERDLIRLDQLQT